MIFWIVKKNQQRGEKMGELYNPYPKLPKNIRQIGERDQIVKLYVEDYVNTYLKRLYPTGGQDLRVGLLLGECRMQDGVPYVFVEGAMEMEDAAREGQKVEFSDSVWKAAYQTMEQMFPKRNILGWFLCGAQGSALSPLNYWKQHGQYFAARNQLMYLNCGLEGEEAIYTASEEGFYKLRGYSIYYERNQMMQDYMVSRKDARRVESGSRDAVIQDFRQKMEENRLTARRRYSTVGVLGMTCGILSVLVLSGGVVMFNNYHKMRAMESVIASVVPEGTGRNWTNILTQGEHDYSSGLTALFGEEEDKENENEVEIEEIPGEVYPTRAEIVIEPGDGSPEGSDSAQAAAEAAGNGVGAAGNDAGAAGNGVGAGENGAGTAGHGGGAAGNDAETAGKGSGAAGNGAGSAGSNAGVGTIAGGNATAGGVFSGSKTSESGNTSAENREIQSGAGSQTAAEPVQIPSDAVRYVVQNGETLYGICMERYHSMANIPIICQWNQMADENHLMVGQELWLPPSEER